MNIVKFAVRYPVSVLMIVLGTCLLGIISYNKLGTDLFPDLKNPSLYVNVEVEDYPPEDIEQEYADNIESIAARQEGVTNVRSASKVGSVLVTVEYNWDQDMDAAYLDLQRSLSSISQDTDIENFIVSRYDANTEPIMIITLGHDEIKDMNELRNIAENYLRNELVRLEGVADIEINGEQEAYVDVSTNTYMLDAFGLTVDDIASKIESLNRNVSGGNITHKDIQYTIKGVNLLETLDDIKNIIVDFKELETEDGTVTTSAPIYLKDLAEVSLKNRDPENIVRFNNERVLSISIYKENQYNTLQAVENVQNKLEDFRTNMAGYHFNVISNQGDFIAASIGEVQDSALMGVLLAMIILFVFLRRINTTLIVSVSIPISIITTFNLMYFNGLTINIMTLGGLALGAGMLIDNAIVVVESIFRNLENGLSPKDAAIKGTSDVAGAITSSTLTTIVVFLPIVYIQGAAGELFKEQAWTVSFSLISSLLVAMLLMPMLASRYIKTSNRNKTSVQISGYGRFVGNLLKHRYIVVLCSLLLVGGSYMLVSQLDMDFMPQTDSKEFSTFVSLEQGTRLEYTDQAVSTLETVITNLVGDDIEWMFTQVGPRDSEDMTDDKLDDTNDAEIRVKLKDDAKIHPAEIMNTLNSNYSQSEDIKVSFEQDQSALSSILGNTSAPVVVEVKGDDLEVLEDLSDKVKMALSSVKGIYDVHTSMEAGAPEVNLVIDRLKIGMYGIDISTVVSQIENALSGRYAGFYEVNSEPVDIEITLPDVDLVELRNLEIEVNNQIYRVEELAEINIGTAPQEIIRNNQTRISQITAMLESGYSLGKVTPEINKVLEQIEFPSTYSAQITGEEEKRAESFNGLSFALILSIILVYMVMASQFESLRHPFTILLTIPLAGVGSIYALLMAGASLNIMAFIGIIMLAGIAVNNSILLVDAAGKLQQEGLALTEAIQTAAQQRIRPIIMTSLTTILALIPMIFDLGSGSSLRSSMALTVIGGLITSTIMTLVVIPCVYYIFDKKK